jgi:hypothetical protein
MRVRMARLVVAVVAFVPLTLIATGAAAAPGPGTFTKITTPTSEMYHFSATATNNLSVSGQASNDVTSVDIDCIFNTSGGPSIQKFATAVPVTGGVFGTTAVITSYPANCRLRAIPTAVDATTAYIGSYSGPIMYFYVFAPSHGGGHQIGYTAAGEQGSGIGSTQEAGDCSGDLLATVSTPAMDVLGPGSAFCAFALPSGNLTSTGTSTASSIRVDGHSAYLPDAVYSYLNQTQSLGVTQTTLTTTFAHAANGDVTVTESAPLVRCSVDDTYPPTLTSCPNVVSTGVTFHRTVNIFRGAHQVRLRDSYAATNGHSHTVAVQYIAGLHPPDTGATGFAFPGHSSTYSVASPNQVVTGLGTKAATLLARSDIRAVEGDKQADTIGLSWSRAPSKIQFSGTSADDFAMPYSLTVPAGGTAYVGFASSEGNTTAEAKKVAALATGEVVVAPTITSPKSGATITGHRTTVKGRIVLGANGMPTSVTVNGHAATLTKVNATTDSYVATFSESFGKHKLTVTAKDVAGNTKSATRTVTNAA